MDQATLYQTQISLTEWFLNLKHCQTEALRIEDNDKRERLKVLNQIIGLPFDQPTQFDAPEIATPSPRFKKFLADHGQELCALRLIPLDPVLPKLRMRGLSINQVVSQWFPKQPIDPIKYRADFMPHSEKYLASTIFIVNNKGVFGEIIAGGHFQLTQGFYDNQTPLIFSSDFKVWKFSQNNPLLQRKVKAIIKLLTVKSLKTQKSLVQKLNAQFSHHILQGYFETVEVEEFGLWFVDYNRILAQMYQGYQPSPIVAPTNPQNIFGQTGSPGQVIGKVKIILHHQVAQSTITEEEILVCDMTTPDCVQLMKKSLAIVTDKGGILSHAAIISRELGKPCISATVHATTILKNGDLIKVDADRGIIEIIKQS